MDSPVARRFWSKVNMLKGDGCWKWKAARRNKYGAFRLREKTLEAHRIAWMLAVGEIPPGVFVCHRCDCRECVRPSHLFLGMPIDNSQDMMQKGRSTRGETNPRAKLTIEDVKKIRVLSQGGVKQRIIAKKFNIAQTNVSMIVRRKTWKHVA